MAASPTPRPKPAKLPLAHRASFEASLRGHVAWNPPNPALAALRQLQLTGPLAVAYSGGADSTALLLAAAEYWPGQVQAIHIHHGLQAAADDFARVCESVCAKLTIPLHIVHVDALPAKGDSPEDAARRARYAALSSAAKQLGLGSILLGQHADDQVETLLLALSRGAGLPGLSGKALETRMRAHAARVRRLLAQHEKMMGK